MPSFPRVRVLLLWWLGSVAAWGVVALGFAAQLVFAAEVEWEPALRAAVREWAPWALLSPAVVGLAVGFPFERGRWPVSLFVHIGGCIVAVVLCGAISQAIDPRDEGGPAGPRGRRAGEGLPPGPGGGQPPPDGGRLPGDGPPPRGRPGGAGRGFGPGRAPVMMRGPMMMRARLNVPVYWILVTITGAVLQARRAGDRERRSLELAASLAEARLTALRAQLQPHFLFNALNAISTLVHRDPAAADEMLANLSDFLRLTLEHSGSQELSLAQELEFVRRYLAIEQVRFGDRLTVAEEFPEETLGARVPVLLLQPLVENALKHGIQPRVGPGRVELSGRREGSGLVLRIDDDGVGVGGVGAGEGTAGTGLGIANTRSRLRELYGEAARLELLPRPGGGTRVEVRLPYHTEPFRAA